ncbi:L-rhamnose 1-dehydrogenase (NADP(+)) [uncultured archaeon]|nr:L-rhamnose 1-dehydrogenase (NADP(+)) [uncultured archaeon]
MKGKNEQKVALVTGGSQGIGRSIAEAFAEKGYAVAIFSRTEADVKEAAGGISAKGSICEGHALDVSDFEAVSSAFRAVAEKRGRLDVLVTCAGVYGPIGALEENDPAAWEQAIRINLCGTMFAVRAAIPFMKRQSSGCIITLAGGGVGGPSIKPNFSSYISSKFAV